jgi:seipin
MLALTLLAPGYKKITTPTTTVHARPLPTLSLQMTSIKDQDVIYSTRRPALLRYSSRLISLSERLVGLPLYILGLRMESEVLVVNMAENLTFEKGKGKGVPGYAMVEVQAGQSIQIYSGELSIRARFGGLRWWMWNHRFLSAVVGVAVFWGASCFAAISSWIFLRVVFAPASSPAEENIKEGEGKEETSGQGVKEEEERGTNEDPDLSDTPRTFPTYGRQTPLRFEPRVKSEPAVKSEEEEEEEVLMGTRIQPLRGEADDEEEDDGGYGGRDRDADSGLGTSYSEGGEGGSRSLLARRRGKGG